MNMVLEGSEPKENDKILKNIFFFKNFGGFEPPPKPPFKVFCLFSISFEYNFRLGSLKSFWVGSPHDLKNKCIFLR